MRVVRPRPCGGSCGADERSGGAGTRGALAADEAGKRSTSCHVGGPLGPSAGMPTSLHPLFFLRGTGGRGNRESDVSSSGLPHGQPPLSPTLARGKRQTAPHGTSPHDERWRAGRHFDEAAGRHPQGAPGHRREDEDAADRRALDERAMGGERAVVETAAAATGGGRGVLRIRARRGGRGLQPAPRAARERKWGRPPPERAQRGATVPLARGRPSWKRGAEGGSDSP